MSFSKTRLRVTEHHVEWLKLSGLSEKMKLFSMIQFLVIVWGSADPLAENSTKKDLNELLEAKTRQNIDTFPAIYSEYMIGNENMPFLHCLFVQKSSEMPSVQKNLSHPQTKHEVMKQEQK